jgi:hypothetical protein
VCCFRLRRPSKNHGDFEKAVCVILDINLNDGLSGIELRHRLKAAGISVPVIYMTGNDNPPSAWPRCNPGASPIPPKRFRKACHGLIKIKATKARRCLIAWQHPLDGIAGPMKRDTLYFQLSVVWLVILAGGLVYLWFR